MLVCPDSAEVWLALALVWVVDAAIALMSFISVAFRLALRGGVVLVKTVVVLAGEGACEVEATGSELGLSVCLVAAA